MTVLLIALLAGIAGGIGGFPPALSAEAGHGLAEDGSGALGVAPVLVGADAAVEAPPPRAMAVLAEIQRRHGEPPPGYVGGRRFRNRERQLPRGIYQEYDVEPRHPGRRRGPERIVIEQGSGKAYYSADHYRTFVPMN